MSGGSTSAVPFIKFGDASVKALSGNFKGHKGTAEGVYVKVRLLDVGLHAPSSRETYTNKEDALFVTAVKDSGPFSDGQAAAEGNAVLFCKG
jgi:hypothetical protein